MRPVVCFVVAWSVALSLAGCATRGEVDSADGSNESVAVGQQELIVPLPPAPAGAPGVVTGDQSTTNAAEPTTTVATPTTVGAPEYVFPFAGRDVSYGRTHHDYPASDVFGCGAFYVAPIAGEIVEVSTIDRWDPEVNDPATRGGLFISLVGVDGVRYYAAHLEQVLVESGDVAAAGDPLGVVGQTGNARDSACHLHFGISRPCNGPEWAVRRGEIWPWPYLDAWRAGESKSPALEVYATVADVPDACVFAENSNGESIPGD